MVVTEEIVGAFGGQCIFAWALYQHYHRLFERGERRFTALRADIRGTRDSLHWLGGGALGSAAGLRAGGWVALADTVVMGVDSLVLETAGDQWRLAPGARVTVRAVRRRAPGDV
jgi:hypothetical protein